MDLNGCNIRNLLVLFISRVKSCQQLRVDKFGVEGNDVVAMEKGANSVEITEILLGYYTVEWPPNFDQSERA